MEEREGEEWRAVEEAGGGESEGFEMAEEALVENAEYTSGEGIPRLEEYGDDEAERDPATYGEADEEQVSELVRDPEQGLEDPDADTPDISADR